MNWIVIAVFLVPLVISVTYSLHGEFKERKARKHSDPVEMDVKTFLSLKHDDDREWFLSMVYMAGLWDEFQRHKDIPFGLTPDGYTETPPISRYAEDDPETWDEYNRACESLRAKNRYAAKLRSKFRELGRERDELDVDDLVDRIYRKSHSGGYTTLSTLQGGPIGMVRT